MENNAYNSTAKMNLAAIKCLETGDYEGALEKLTKGLELLPKGLIPARAQLHSNRGHALENLQRYQDALASFTKAADIFQALGDKINLGEQLGNIGSVFRDIERWDESLDIYFEALKIFKEEGHKSGMADQCSNIGYSYTRKDELKNALKFFGEAKALYDELGNVGKAQLCDQNLQAIKPYVKA